MNKKKLVAISAPSGGGKSVVTRHILNKFPDVIFSVSATTRQRRPNEVDGKDYFFLTKEKFEELIAQNQLIEWEELFGNYYGTLKSEVQKAINKNKIMLFDIDVKGALSLKKHFPNDTLLIFLAPPSKEVLIERLKKRGTESEEQLKNRLARAELEISMSKEFDQIIVNDILEETLQKVEQVFIENCQ
ncbi:MAG: guanylate kinase [Ignavibacteria bacterium]|nr:guanylate kinase [Ignavibacteria bacterium]